MINGPLGEVLLAAQASARVVIVAEEIVDTSQVLAEGISVPGLLTTAVVHHPGAVAPDGVIGRYDRDVAAYEDYVARASTPEGFAAWLSALGSDVLAATGNAEGTARG